MALFFHACLGLVLLPAARPFRGHSVHSPVFRHEQLAPQVPGMGLGQAFPSLRHSLLTWSMLISAKALYHDLDSRAHALQCGSRAPLTTSPSWKQNPRDWSETSLEWEVSLLFWGSPRSPLFRMPLGGSASVGLGRGMVVRG